MSLIEDIRKDREVGTPGPWVNETVRTSCGTCHKVGPFPSARPEYKPDTHACLYDDYPPGKGHPHLLANASRIARVPDMEAALLAAEELANSFEAYQNAAVDHMDFQIEVEAALAAYREATQ